MSPGRAGPFHSRDFTGRWEGEAPAEPPQLAEYERLGRSLALPRERNSPADGEGATSRPRPHVAADLAAGVDPPPGFSCAEFHVV